MGGVRRVDDAHDEDVGADPGLEFGGGAFGGGAAVVDDGDALGQAVGLFEVLGGEQDGGACAAQFVDGVPQPQRIARRVPRDELLGFE